MKIAYITAGAAGMYCGSCLHDNTLAAALQREGHEVALIPTYTPIRTDETDVSTGNVFFGALNVYLQQKTSFFRHTPSFLNRMLDSTFLLNWVSRRSGSTDAKNLGELTLSMLQGEQGHQHRELERLVDWLAAEFRPDLLHLTNSMFLGLARRLKQVLGVPVLCSVQGEDIFLDELVEPHRSQVLLAMKERARDVDGLVATSRYYADYMASLLDFPAERMHQVHLGVKLEGHGEAPAVGRSAGTAAAQPAPLVIGYLARICREKGLHLLVQALHDLTEKLGPGKVRVRAAGWLGTRDRPYMESIKRQVRQWGLEDAFEYVGEVGRDAKLAFLKAADIISVPTLYHEPKGLYVLEALASGRPVVQPAHGAFPELMELTSGGLLFEPGSRQSYCEALERLRLDPGLRADLGRQGREAVHRDFSDGVMAENTLNLYERCLTMASTP